MSVSKACKSGACQTCTYGAAQCDCQHHLHGSVLTAERVPAPTVTMPNPVFEAEVARRSNRLCAAAEPHRIGMCCVVHLAEARRQLMGAWLGQSPASEVA